MRRRSRPDGRAKQLSAAVRWPAKQLPARPMAHQLGLVVDRTHRHEPLARTTAIAFVDRRCVNLVAFAAAHVGLHMRGRNEPSLHVRVSWDQRLPPMMRRGARLHRHHGRRQLREKRDQLAAREFARHNDLALRVDRVNLKLPLRQIETNPRDSRQIQDRLAPWTASLQMGF